MPDQYLVIQRCALIVQAAGFVAAHISEEENAIKILCAGSMAIPRMRRSLHDIYQSLGNSYFWHAYRIIYKKIGTFMQFWHPVLILCAKGGAEGGEVQAAADMKWPNYDKCLRLMI